MAASQREAVVRTGLALLLLLSILATILLWSVTFGGRVLVPFDNLYAFPPWDRFAAQLGVGVPHNQLLSDLLLENYAWKLFIRRSLAAHQLPLWNPYLFAGVPFLAAGQHSALYPLSVLFYVLPVAQAYGWFTLLQLVLAGLFAGFFARTIRLSDTASATTAVTYAFSGFFIVSVDFPMVLAAACWLPLVLAMIERLVQKAEAGDRHPTAYVPYASLGAVAVGVMALAGHAEIALYVLLVSAFYALCRLVLLWLHRRDRGLLIRAAMALAAMVALGLALGAVQLIPLYELVRHNFRQGSVRYADVIGWAYPLRQIVAFFVPDVFGNPAHHRYFDLFTRTWQPFTHNALGEPVDNPFWGIKNYVEAGSYVGILPPILALVALLVGLRRRDQHRPYVVIFAVLAGASLLFAFGTPAYALLYYGVPGFNQLHSPFRWVFPYTLAIAVLAGIGAQVLASMRQRPTQWPRAVAWLTFSAGAVLLIALLGVFFQPGAVVGLADRLVASSDLAQHAFPNGAAFLSYEWRNLFWLALALIGAGAVLRVSYCPIYLPRRLGGHLAWKPLAILVLSADLLVIGHGFNPAADPALARFTPPAVQFLQAQKGLFRITSLDSPTSGKILNPNVGMFYGLQDIRGYDSIIPKQYADFMGLIETQGQLLYNRISPLYWRGSLDSALLDLLNVRYVLTREQITNSHYRLVYDDDLRIYENTDVLPRAFIVPRARVILDGTRLAEAMRSLNPRAEVLVEEDIQAGKPACCTPIPTIIRYTANEVVIEVDLPEPAWLVLTDSYFPGWKAYRLAKGSDEEELLHIYRADYNFRAVYLPAGRQTVRFKYSPMSFKVGLFTSFLAGIILLLAAGYWAWGRIYQESAGDHPVKRIAKNSLTPMSLSLVNKAMDTAFAMLMLRILGPTLAGRYAFAIFIIGYFAIFTNFGLSTLLMREVAKDRSQANRYLSNTAALRMALSTAMVPVLALFLFVWRHFFALTDDTTWAIILFAVGLIPSNLSAALSSVFSAHEKMEVPAVMTSVTTVMRVTLGAAILLLGYGFVGLAAVSVIVNTVTAGIFFFLVARTFFRPRLEVDPAFERSMVGTSYPLMINDILATIFFRVDVTLLQPMKGDTVVGWYTTAYKFIDGLNIIPSAFTIAIFPIMSRYAASARDSLIRAYLMALKFLVVISLPVALLTTRYAEGIILFFGGPEYLPHSAIALRLLIWFLPFSFINSVTHYVLIAIDQQHFLTRAFFIGVAFNLAANLAFIPQYGYRAAAVITILSEIVLLIPFYWCLRRNLAAIPWVGLLWRPVVALAVAAALLLMLWSRPFYLLIPVVTASYAAVLAAVGTFDAEDRAVMRRLLPGR
jgi:O-antigen/teichoic acid export membrane protein